VKRLRLLLDQMLDEEVAQALRDLGHDVVRVSEVGLACADDEAILGRAVSEGRVLLTLDEHFGDWTVLPLSRHFGVVRVKADPATSRNVLALMLPFLERAADSDLRNHLVILRPRGARWVRTAAPSHPTQTHVGQAPAISGDLDALLRDAPRAVDSFHPYHWKFMKDLERRAQEVVMRQAVEQAVEFLVDVVYLKRPYGFDRDTVRRQLLGHPSEIAAALRALCDVDRLDYDAMEVLACVPRFGVRGGRAFNSAVFRLVKPQSFGIIDWRNVAVLAGATGFEGLVSPPVEFSQFSRDDILALRGHLPFTMDVYRAYNDVLRALAQRYERTAAEIDLVLWTYSIQRQPFGRLAPRLFSSLFVLTPQDRESLRRDHRPVAERMVERYLTSLKETGWLTPDHLIRELSSLFLFIRDECKAFGRGKQEGLRSHVNRIVAVLDEAIGSGSPKQLLSLWTRWQNMVDTLSRSYRGISLPGSMVLEGYMVLEDFIPVKRYVESVYDAATLEPKHACE